MILNKESLIIVKTLFETGLNACKVKKKVQIFETRITRYFFFWK